MTQRSPLAQAATAQPHSMLQSRLRWLRASVDPFVALALGVVYCLWLLGSVHDLGYARDEGFYFSAADSYRKWFEILFEDPNRAIQQTLVDKYWRVNHEHPALVKSLFAFSKWILHDELRWFDEPGTSYRFVGMAFSSLAIAVTYLWGRRALAAHGDTSARIAGIVAAAGFALMPRVFYHSHLDCFDMPVLAMWMLTTYVYWRGFERPSFGWSLAAGVLYGLLLNTKHNSWLLPFALVAHALYHRGLPMLADLRAGRFAAALRRVPKALWFMATLGPLLFYATWPWIWFDTLDRLREYVLFHTKHVYYNMEFLGQTYFAPPFPRLYAPLMTLATVPAITLALAGLGVLAASLSALRGVGSRFRCWVYNSGFWHCFSRPPADSAEHERLSTRALWLLCILVSYAPWVSEQSPIFGGTKHWMTAYPFMALFAGEAFLLASRVARSAFEVPWWQRSHLVEAVMALCVLVAPYAITRDSHPWGLSTYTPIVGGSPGGATLGLNRSFWGYTTGAVQDEINALARPGTKIFVHDTALSAFRMMVRDGRLEDGLRPQLSVAYSRIALYHHEQHMSRVEHQIWTEYGTVRPFTVAGPDGVPVVWVYERVPDAPQKRAGESR